MVRRVDDISIDDEFTDVVKISGDLNSFNFIFAPSQLTRDDFAVSSDPLRMTLRVLVFDIDSGCEGPNRVTINRPQFFIEPSILFRTACHLLDEPVGMNANPDVSHHCSNGFKAVSYTHLTLPTSDLV